MRLNNCFYSSHPNKSLSFVHNPREFGRDLIVQYQLILKKIAVLILSYNYELYFCGIELNFISNILPNKVLTAAMLFSIVKSTLSVTLKALVRSESPRQVCFLKKMAGFDSQRCIHPRVPF